MTRRPSYPFRIDVRPALRHIWRHHARDLADLVFRVSEFADAGDRVNLLRQDGRRFTIVRNDRCFLVRDAEDRPIGTFGSVGECIEAGDRYLDDAEDARAQHAHDFGGDDPKGAA